MDAEKKRVNFSAYSKHHVLEFQTWRIMKEPYLGKTKQNLLPVKSKLRKELAAAIYLFEALSLPGLVLGVGSESIHNTK
jgi:hypothetical protein